MPRHSPRSDPRHLDEAAKARLRRAVLAPARGSLAEIAARFRMDRGTLYDFRLRHGLPVRRRFRKLDCGKVGCEAEN